MSRALLSNLNAVVFAIGLTSLETGVAAEWSAGIAAIVGGAVLMLIGLWPYIGIRRKAQ